MSIIWSDFPKLCAESDCHGNDSNEAQTSVYIQQLTISNIHKKTKQLNPITGVYIILSF